MARDLDRDMARELESDIARKLKGARATNENPNAIRILRVVS